MPKQPQRPKPIRPRRYLCTTCPARFDRPSSLKTHIYTHTGEKPNKCTLCGYSFASKSNLYRHMRVCSNGLTALERPQDTLSASSASQPMEHSGIERPSIISHSNSSGPPRNPVSRGAPSRRRDVFLPNVPPPPPIHSPYAPNSSWASSPPDRAEDSLSIAHSENPRGPSSPFPHVYQSGSHSEPVSTSSGSGNLSAPPPDPQYFPYDPFRGTNLSNWGKGMNDPSIPSSNPIYHDNSEASGEREIPDENGREDYLYEVFNPSPSDVHTDTKMRRQAEAPLQQPFLWTHEEYPHRSLRSVDGPLLPLASNVLAQHLPTPTQSRRTPRVTVERDWNRRFALSHIVSPYAQLESLTSQRLQRKSWATVAPSVDAVNDAPSL